METTVQIRQRGTLTLPVEIREKYGIQAGDIITRLGARDIHNRWWRWWPSWRVRSSGCAWKRA